MNEIFETYLLYVEGHVFGAKLVQAVISTPSASEGMHLHESRHVGDKHFHLKKCRHRSQIRFHMGNRFPCLNQFSLNSSILRHSPATSLDFLARFRFPQQPISLNGSFVHHSRRLRHRLPYMISGGRLINGHESFLLLLMGGSHCLLFNRVGSIGHKVQNVYIYIYNVWWNHDRKEDPLN